MSRAAAAWAVVSAALLAGCARDAAPATFAVPDVAAARIRMTCPPRPPADAAAPDCPPPLPRLARAQ